MLPPAMSFARKMERVDQVIALLNLVERPKRLGDRQGAEEDIVLCDVGAHPLERKAVSRKPVDEY